VLVEGLLIVEISHVIHLYETYKLRLSRPEALRYKSEDQLRDVSVFSHGYAFQAEILQLTVPVDTVKDTEASLLFDRIEDILKAHCVKKLVPVPDKDIIRDVGSHYLLIAGVLHARSSDVQGMSGLADGGNGFRLQIETVYIADIFTYGADCGEFHGIDLSSNLNNDLVYHFSALFIKCLSLRKAYRRAIPERGRPPVIMVKP